MNRTIRLQGGFDGEGPGLVLRIAASTVYRAFVDGRLVAYGPARCAHGYFRVDEWPLESGLPGAASTLRIEAVGYSVNCYAYLDQPAFVQAELARGDRALLHTGPGGGLDGGLDATRAQKVQRYSFQRSFAEAYRMPSDEAQATVACAFEAQPEKQLLPRRVPLPLLAKKQAAGIVSVGQAVRGNKPNAFHRQWNPLRVGPLVKGFADGELDVNLADDLCCLSFGPGKRPEEVGKRSDGVGKRPDGNGDEPLAEGGWRIYDLGRNLTGLISLEAACEEAATLYLMFDETLDEDGQVNYLRMTCLNALRFDLPAGRHALLAMEPYTLRYLQAFCARGQVALDRPGLVEYKANLPLLPRPAMKDPQLAAVYDAAVETLLQNSADIFMDCPSRERAGWLCDSFFTARAEKQITGQNLVEENFLENYLLPARFEHLPEGMVAMCYPSDHNDGVFIPNWGMWLVLELEDYLKRGGRRKLADAFQPRVEALLRYFEGFLNEDGLLEDLDGWVFLDWSRANDKDVACGVNYPSNMLYARALEAASALYGNGEYAARAKAIHQTIRRQSYNGACFADNRARDDGGVLVPGPATTEACQNYAFFCGTATPESHPALWADFLKKFDPDKQLNNSYSLDPANAFIGLYVRLAALAAANRRAEIEDEIRRFFLPQAALTGTLWEQLSTAASLNHGFAAYAANLLAMLD
jgi:alpha-L-rhamnosidase